MSFISELNESTKNVVVEEAKDFTGFQPLETDVYKATIKAVYEQPSKTGSKVMTMVVIADVNGREITDRFMVTNKEGKPYYNGKKDPTKKYYLEGFNKINALCRCATGVDLVQCTEANIFAEIFNSTTKKKERTQVVGLPQLTGKSVLLGIEKQKVDKKEKCGDEWIVDGTKIENHIGAIFCAVDKAYGASANELKNQETPKYMNTWIEQNKGKLIDKSTAPAQQPDNAINQPLNGAW